MHDTEATVTFTLTVQAPRYAAGDLAAAITGNDDDVILAAERVLRDATDCEDIEVDVEHDVLDYLSEEARIEESSARIYGPARRG